MLSFVKIMLPYCLFKSASRAEQVVFSDRIISQLLAVSSILSETRGFSGGSATLNFRRRDSESAVIFLDSKIPSEISYDSC